MSLDLNCYGIIGDMRTCALVSDKGSIDWLCMPRFDSEAVLLRLLDDERGGFCDIQFTGCTRSTRRYLPGTNILETILEGENGSLRIEDFFSVRRSHAGKIDSESDKQCIRLMECISGSVEFFTTFRPSFGFATSSHHVSRGANGVVFEAIVNEEVTRLAVQCGPHLHDVHEGQWHAQLKGGDKSWFSIQYLEADQDLYGLDDAAIDAKLGNTRNFWEEWSSRCIYHGRWEEPILRSVLSLKLLTYAPTGAIAAAATCGLPEVVGGERNWDYRFCWLRDASFTVSSFLNCGYRHEARRFLDFIAQQDPSCGNNLKVLYPLAGLSPEERLLEHLSGWNGSRPVRVGNQASEQVQLDIYGEYLSALAMYLEFAEDAEVDEMRQRVSSTVHNILSLIDEQWQRPDQGLWEMQLPAEQHLHSKGMCFVAIDRALKLGKQLGLGLDEGYWLSLQATIQGEYFARAWSEADGALMQTYSLDRLDASAMRLVLYDALSMDDAKTQSTVDAIVQRLSMGDLVYRYHGDDGLPGQEGCFTVCSFWLASMYAYQGDAEQALGLVERMLRRANDLGLFSEEMLAGGFEQIGNFPQAFTHMGVINNGMRILKLLGQPTSGEPS